MQGVTKNTKMNHEYRSQRTDKLIEEIRCANTYN